MHILESIGYKLTKPDALVGQYHYPDSPLIDNAIKAAKDKMQPLTAYGPDRSRVVLPLDRRGSLIHQAGVETTPFTSWLRPIMKEYIKSVYLEEPGPMKKSMDQFMMYGIGAGIELHADDTANKSYDPYRRFTVLLYTNEDYEGGELVLPQHNLTIKPKIGDVVIFPANGRFLHKVNPITKGERRLIMQCWGWE